MDFNTIVFLRHAFKFKAFFLSIKKMGEGKKKKAMKIGEDPKYEEIYLTDKN